MNKYSFVPLLKCICGESKHKTISIFDRNGLIQPTVICSKCSTIRYKNYIKPDQLRNFYSDTYQRLYGRKSNSSVESRQRSSAEILLSSINTSKINRVCEIGCSQGHTIGILQRLIKCEAHGYDLDKSDILLAIKQYPCTNYHTGDCFSEKLPNDIDLVYLIHVFEHLYDPLKFLEFIKPRMSDNGSLILVVPDIFWAINNSMLPKLISYLHIAHPWNFSDAGILLLAEKSGFHVDKLPKFKHKTRPAETWYILRKILSPQLEKNYDKSYNCQKVNVSILRAKFLASSILSFSLIKRFLHQLKQR